MARNTHAAVVTIAALAVATLPLTLTSQATLRLPARTHVWVAPGAGPGGASIQLLPYQQDSVTLDSTLRAHGATGSVLKAALEQATPVFKRIEEEESGSASRFFRSAGGGATSDRAYVTSELWSGSLGPKASFVRVSVAHAVAFKDTATTVATKEFQQRLADALAVVEHGGGFTADLGYQVETDPNRDIWTSAGIRLSAGTIGITSASNDRSVFGGDVEAALSKKLYDRSSSSSGPRKVSAEIYAVVRRGYHRAPAGILDGLSDVRSINYLQVSVALRAGGKTFIGFAGTKAGKGYEPYVVPFHFFTSVGL